MKYKLLLLLCIASVSYCAAQSKEELIDVIIKRNVYESEHIGNWMLSRQYAAFQELAGMLSKKELVKLSNHKNGVLRTYACAYLIDHNEADPAALFVNELKRSETIETLDGCLGDEDFTSQIIYFCYRTKICLEAAKDIQYEEKAKREKAMADILTTDSKMKELDSIVISTDLKPDYYLYRMAFENNNFSPALLPEIEKLGFQKHNPYAIGYLTTAYPEVYKDLALKHYTFQFPKLTFSDDDRNGMMYFHEFLELLLKTGDKKIQQIAVNSLKKSQYSDWPWFKNTFEEYNVKI